LQEEVFKRREEQLKLKDLELQESLIRFSKFLQENDSKRARAEKKAADEIKARLAKEKEIEQLSDVLEELRLEKERIHEVLEKNMRWVGQHPAVSSWVFITGREGSQLLYDSAQCHKPGAGRGWLWDHTAGSEQCGIQPCCLVGRDAHRLADTSSCRWTSGWQKWYRLQMGLQPQQAQLQHLYSLRPFLPLLQVPALPGGCPGGG
jgi:hypothetical protein